MTMKIRDFYALVDLEVEPNLSMLSDLENLIARYPLFQAGIFIYIKCLYLNDAPNYVSELNRLSPFIHDRKALFYYVLSDVYERFKAKPKTEQIVDRTNMLIDAFFETNNERINLSFDDPLTYAIQNPSMASLDYLSYIGASEEISSHNSEARLISDGSSLKTPKMKGQDIIDRFIEKSDELEAPILPIDLDKNLPMSKNSDFDDEESEDDFFFTHALVDIYIKQKKYARAYEIIKRLSLNYPEKNIYFADQLKFLEKHLENLE